MTRRPVIGSACFRSLLLCLLVGVLAVASRSSGSSIEPVLRISGPPPPAQFAWSIANAGDFNGDGYEDLIVGALNPSPSESSPPHAGIYFGGPLADSIPDVVLDGVIPVVTSAGDMNGDGYGDVILPYPSPWGEPQARVYFGGRVPDGIPDLLLRDDPGDWLGFRGSAAAEDFNGDGFSDILLAAPGFYDPDDLRSVGRAYLFLGGASPNGEPDTALESDLPIFSCPDCFARHVAPAGDLNGDGFGDFLVTRDRTLTPPHLGSTLIYLGGTDVDVIPDASLTTLVSSPTGGSIVTAGDLNADGIRDVAVQGAVFTTNGYRSGCIYVYLGAVTANPGRTPDLIIGEGLATASTLLGGNDVNADGHADLVVGYVGKVQVYFGGAELDSEPDITLDAEPGGEGFGFGVSVLDWTGDGVADVAVAAPFPGFSAGPGEVFIYDLAEPLQARVLPEAERRPIPIADAAPAPLRIRFEPVEGSYASGDVDPSSIRLHSDAAGEVSEISAITGKATVEGDWDRNGVTDLLASFSGADLARLFSNVVGRKTVDVTLEGRLRSRRRFAAPASLTIAGTGPRGDLTAAVQPNPLNPGGTLSFRVGSPGAVTARLFDLHGRCVRTLLRSTTLNAGEHRIQIDGHDDAGRVLASGVYFYRIDSPDGPARGRLVVAK